MPASLSDFVDFADVEIDLADQWPVMARCVQALGPYFQAKIATGTEPLDVLAGLYLGITGQATTVKDWRFYVNASNQFVIEENTGSDASPTWVNRLTLAAGGGGSIPTHASTHQHGGADEIATATPGANAIVKALGTGLLATGWLTGVIRNAEVSASAAIAYSKLNLAGSLVNADVSASAAIAYSKLNLAGSIVNADVSGSAAIAYSKLALTGNIVNADINASAAIAVSKLAALTGSRTVGTTSGGVLTPIGGIREVLTAARTYYVRSDGSNSNDGLTNSSGGAFLTLAKAISTVGALDLSTFAVTIQIGLAGSYAGFSATQPFVGGPGSSVTLIGDTAAPGSYVITSTVTVSNRCAIVIRGVDFTPSSGDGLAVSSGATVTISGACHCGAASGARQILAAGASAVLITAVLTSDGSASHWLLAVDNSIISSNGLVHVFSGTPAYSAATVQAQTGAIISVVNGTPSGAATGKRYDSTLNAVIFTNGGGANFFPGNVAGTATTGLYA